MSLLDTVEPAAWLITATDRNGEVLIRTCCMKEEEARGLMQAAIDKGGYAASNVSIETMLSRTKVESLLSQCRKEALLEAAEKIDYRSGYPMSDMWRKHCADELRRMAEGEKIE